MQTFFTRLCHSKICPLLIQKKMILALTRFNKHSIVRENPQALAQVLWVVFVLADQSNCYSSCFKNCLYQLLQQLLSCCTNCSAVVVAALATAAVTESHCILVLDEMTRKGEVLWLKHCCAPVVVVPP